MDKIRQRKLITWLKQQSIPAQPYLRLLKLLGLCTGLVIVAQAYLLATLLQELIMQQLPRDTISSSFILLIGAVITKALLAWLRERIGFRCGMRVRQVIRQQTLDRLQQFGPAWIQGKPAGSWATIILEQIEDMQDYYARYLPQMHLAVFIPVIIVIAIIPINWVAAVILMVTAPLIPLFMILVGMGATEANRRNFIALSRLSGNFLDRLRGLETLRLFYRTEPEAEQIHHAAEGFRQRTMDVLKLAFLSSAVLEFFASISIAVVAVYFGFSYLGEFHFGSYSVMVTLSAGFLALILAPEFFQPLRDLGTFYHAKAQAVGAAESLLTFLTAKDEKMDSGIYTLDALQPPEIIAENLIILSATGQPLVGPLNFYIAAGQSVAIVGHSGAGKSSLLNTLLGFLPYQGSLTINGIELRQLNADNWRQHLSWVGQNPHLPEQTIRDNLLLGRPDASEAALYLAIQHANITEFLALLPKGLETIIGDSAARLSVGQAQRIAIARALLRPCSILLLDEPTASLDTASGHDVMHALSVAIRQQTTLLVTHLLEDTKGYDVIWVMDNGHLIQTGDYQTLCQQQDGPFAKLLSHRTRER